MASGTHPIHESNTSDARLSVCSATNHWSPPIASTRRPVHLLRYDAASGLTRAGPSAPSVIVFAGPIRMGELAAIEQVRPPPISRLVWELERDGPVGG